MSEDMKAMTTKDDLGRALREGIAAALDPERLRAAVEKELSEAVTRWVRDALGGWGDGSPKELMGEKVRGLVCPAIEGMDLSNARLDLVLSKIVEESVVGERAAMLGRYAELAKPEPGRMGVVKASDILRRYERWLAASYDCAGREVEFEGGPSYGIIECRIELEPEDKVNSWSDYEDATITLLVPDMDDEDDRREWWRELRLWRSRAKALGDGRWYVRSTQFDALSLSSMADIDVYLARLALLGCEVEWDLPNSWGLGEFEPDATPECEWS